jgi:hypothetical protein
MRNAAAPLPTIALTGSHRMLRDGPHELILLGGTVHSSDVQKVAVEYPDGKRVEVPFMYVSPPIDAGFFSYDVPAGRRVQATGPAAVVALDADAEAVHRERVEWPIRLPFPTKRPEPPTHPARPPEPPTAPLQRTSADGVSVVAGRNGIAVFDATRARPTVVSLLQRHRAGWGCLKLRRDGSNEPRHLVIGGKFSRRVGLEFAGVGTPFDACELTGSFGHAWPDRFGSHAPVELPFTEAGRRWFADRAAARDLALFVRSRKVQQIRRLSGDELAAALKASYGNAVVRLSARDDRPSPGTIGYWADESRASFVRVSSTGRRFHVDVEQGRIARENVDPFTRVF